MTNAYCLLNHTLTEKQIAELKSAFGAERIMYPAPALSGAWATIPLEASLTMEHLLPFINWLSPAKKGDILVIQGEMGATFVLVDFALKHGLIPLHSVTKRIAEESRDGEKVFRSYIFEHVCFRQYRYFSDSKGSCTEFEEL